MDKRSVEKILDTYTIEEILEENDMELWELLLQAYRSGIIKFPSNLPTDIEDFE